MLKETSADSAFSDDAAEAKVYVGDKEVDPEKVGLDREKVFELAGTTSSITVMAVKGP